MSPFETQQFKMQALQTTQAENRRKLSPQLVHRFMMHPARTRGELEDVLDDYVERHRKLVEARRALSLQETLQELKESRPPLPVGLGWAQDEP